MNGETYRKRAVFRSVVMLAFATVFGLEAASSKWEAQKQVKRIASHWEVTKADLMSQLQAGAEESAPNRKADAQHSTNRLIFKLAGNLISKLFDLSLAVLSPDGRHLANSALEINSTSYAFLRAALATSRPRIAPCVSCAGEMVDKVLDGASQASLFPRTDLDTTTLGRFAHFARPTSPSSWRPPVFHNIHCLWPMFNQVTASHSLDVIARRGPRSRLRWLPTRASYSGTQVANYTLKSVATIVWQFAVPFVLGVLSRGITPYLFLGMAALQKVVSGAVIAIWRFGMPLTLGVLSFSTLVTAMNPRFFGFDSHRQARREFMLAIRRVFDKLLAALESLLGADTIHADAFRSKREPIPSPVVVGKEGLPVLQYITDRLYSNRRFLAVALEEALQGALSDVQNDQIRDLKLRRVSTGEIAPRLLEARAYDLEDALAIDFAINWESELAFDVDVVPVGALGARVPVSCSRLRFDGFIRIVATPLLDEPPGYGALLVSLPLEPKIGLDVRLVGGEVTKLPWLRDEIEAALQAAIADTMLWPKRIVVPMPEPPAKNATPMLAMIELQALESDDPLLRAEVELLKRRQRLSNISGNGTIRDDTNDFLGEWRRQLSRFFGDDRALRNDGDFNGSVRDGSDVLGILWRQLLPDILLGNSSVRDFDDVVNILRPRNSSARDGDLLRLLWSERSPDNSSVREGSEFLRLLWRQSQPDTLPGNRSVDDGDDVLSYLWRQLVPDIFLGNGSARDFDDVLNIWRQRLPYILPGNDSVQDGDDVLRLLWRQGLSANSSIRDGNDVVRLLWRQQSDTLPRNGSSHERDDVLSFLWRQLLPDILRGNATVREFEDVLRLLWRQSPPDIPLGNGNATVRDFDDIRRLLWRQRPSDIAPVNGSVPDTDDVLSFLWRQILPEMPIVRVRNRSAGRNRSTGRNSSGSGGVRVKGRA